MAADSGLAGLAAGALIAAAGAAAGLTWTGVANPVLTCAAAGSTATSVSAENSIKDFARPLIGSTNPFILNEDPHVRANHINDPQRPPVGSKHPIAGGPESPPLSQTNP